MTSQGRVQPQGLGPCLLHGEIEIRQKVRLGDEEGLRAHKGLWILCRLALSLRHRDQDDPLVFPKIELGRADEVSDILDEEKIEALTVQLPLKVVDTLVDQGRIQMAGPAGGELYHRNAFRAYARCVLMVNMIY
jgi:hypothetical protein